MNKNIYNLKTIEALKLMLDGKKVKCEDGTIFQINFEKELVVTDQNDEFKIHDFLKSDPYKFKEILE
ncbi:hypothetical protein [Fluviispira vulneris]|uniref:hypothetical protein n=1 Tax=Fluviispira vulneris TaxID=2763012 RepID=UPI00164800BD|nr:hypothetical protein [Fluviispira vulneris]